VVNEVHVEKGSAQVFSIAVKVTLKRCKVSRDGSKRDGGSFREEREEVMKRSRKVKD